MLQILCLPITENTDLDFRMGIRKNLRRDGLESRSLSGKRLFSKFKFFPAKGQTVGGKRELRPRQSAPPGDVMKVNSMLGWAAQKRRTNGALLQ